MADDKAKLQHDANMRAGSTGQRHPLWPEELDRLGEEARAEELRYVPVSQGGYGY